MTESSSRSWKKTGEDIILSNCYDHSSIGLYYLRTYTAKAGFSHSDDNNFINNFKKPPKSPQYILKYKNQAISEFQGDLASLFAHHRASPNLLLVPAPTSKAKTDPNYDDRMERVVSQVCSTDAALIYFPAVIREKSIPPQHENPGVRTIDRAMENLILDRSVSEDYVDEAPIIIIDDVLHSGATFAACRKLLLSEFPKSKVLGVFWAISKSKDPTDVLEPFQ